VLKCILLLLLLLLLWCVHVYIRVYIYIYKDFILEMFSMRYANMFGF